MKNNVIITGIIGLMLFLPVSAVEFTVENDDKTFEFDIGGLGGIIGGQIIDGFGNQGPIGHDWVQTGYGAIVFELFINKKTHILFQPEVHLLFSYNTPLTELGKETRLDMFLENYYVYLRNFWCDYTFGNTDRFSMQLGAGKMHYKYNNEVRNLGEYLFRGNAYPTYVLNDFDDPTSPIMGFKWTTNFHTQPLTLELDQILSSETRKYPLQDWSLAWIGKIKFGDFWGHGNFVELGGGICLDRIFEKDEEYTTPTQGIIGDENRYYADTIIDTMRDEFGNIIYDPITLDPLLEKTLINEEYYTFKSEKISIRFTFDLKGFFPWENIFGEEDFKIYTELGLLGLKDYPVYYETLKERRLLMFGFHVPTFKLLDVLALEAEYFKNPYISGSEYAFRRGWPKPVDDKMDPGVRTKFYWSIYAKKTLGAFEFITQFARDHVRPNVNNLSFAERNDVLLESRKSSEDKNAHWWWALKIGFHF